MDIKSRCASCEIQGYWPDLCKAHIRKMVTRKTDKKVEECPHYSRSIVKYGKTAAVGAGVGVVLAAGSMAAIPSVAMKAMFGHVAAVKAGAGAGGGIAGAGINIFRHKKKVPVKTPRKRKRIYFSLFLNGGYINGK